MGDPARFFDLVPATLTDVVAWTGAVASPGADLSRTVGGVATLAEAGRADLAFCDGPKNADALARTRALAVFVPAALADRAPVGTLALAVKAPAGAFALALAKLHPPALAAPPLTGERAISPAAHVDDSADLEEGVVVEAGAVIGAEAEIGAGTIVGPNAVVGPRCRIGRGCRIGAGASVQHALLGDRVTIHPGARLGQDGFGYAPGPRGHSKIPQVGRVVVQDDVEIGANATIDRGAVGDTVVGEGTKIDNLAMIAHNVRVGRHCIVVAQAGVAGSSRLGDYVVLAGQVGVADHLTIGQGAQIGAQAGVMNDVPAGGRWIGSPAMPVREFARFVADMRRTAAGGRGEGKEKP
ncbi:MAG: UDP-3-O-(3-hydroxymyristoyl)glucosamine N-acyltransferase [Hyphomicrobiales bacterium]|nr:UDP-3-O-(3-hydroxymyristoyl)glucosamine N-acyltransferase [Hyphomicrobiales bacterium]